MGALYNYIFLDMSVAGQIGSSPTVLILYHCRINAIILGWMMTPIPSQHDAVCFLEYIAFEPLVGMSIDCSIRNVL